MRITTAIHLSVRYVSLETLFFFFYHLSNSCLDSRRARSFGGEGAGWANKGNEPYVTKAREIMIKGLSALRMDEKVQGLPPHGLRGG